jgi:hypothetical protein
VGEVGPLLEHRLEIADSFLEPAVLGVGLAVEAVAVPDLAHPSHHRAHPALERRQQGEEPALEQRQAVSAVDLVGDRGEAQPHEDDEEESVPARVDCQGHERGLSRG